MLRLLGRSSQTADNKAAGANRPNKREIGRKDVELRRVAVELPPLNLKLTVLLPLIQHFELPLRVERAAMKLIKPRFRAAC